MFICRIYDGTKVEGNVAGSFEQIYGFFMNIKKNHIFHAELYGVDGRKIASF